MSELIKPAEDKSLAVVLEPLPHADIYQKTVQELTDQFDIAKHRAIAKKQFKFSAISSIASLGGFSWLLHYVYTWAHQVPHLIIDRMFPFVILCLIGGVIEICYLAKTWTTNGEKSQGRENSEAVSANPLNHLQHKIFKAILAYNEMVKIINHLFKGIKLGVIHEGHVDTPEIIAKYSDIRKKLEHALEVYYFMRDGKNLLGNTTIADIETELANALIELKDSIRFLPPVTDTAELAQALTRNLDTLEASLQLP